MNLNLKNKTALVCGSTQGIGKAVAMQLAQQQANIILLARNQVELEKVKSQLDTSQNQKHQVLCVDFSQPTELKNILEIFIKSGNQIDILINNTGGPPSGPITNATTEAFLSAFNNHLICNHILVQAVVNGMKAAQFGRIINIISTSVKVPLPNLGVSNTIRAAVANWSKTLANELGPFNITVNNVLPGATETERLKTIIKNKATVSNMLEDLITKEMLAEIPLKRFAQPNEIANAVGFLASPAASYINGINVPVDGGRTPNL